MKLTIKNIIKTIGIGFIILYPSIHILRMFNEYDNNTLLNFFDAIILIWFVIIFFVFIIFYLDVCIQWFINFISNSITIQKILNYEFKLPTYKKYITDTKNTNPEKKQSITIKRILHLEL